MHFALIYSPGMKDRKIDSSYLHLFIRKLELAKLVEKTLPSTHYQSQTRQIYELEEQ